MELDELKSKVFSDGIVGAGGAGFPTHAKLNNLAEVIILNCAECEPLLRVDRQLLIKHTEEILQGMLTLVETLNAEKGIIAIKKAYKSTISAVEAVIEKYNKLELKILRDVYPAGDEVVLVYETTGKVVPEGNIPISQGAVVINVETALNIYNSVFQNSSVIYKYVTVTGEVNNPITVKVPIGISIDKLLKMAGGTKLEEYEILEGGPMTGRVVNKDKPVTKTTKAVIVLPKDHTVIKSKFFNVSLNLKRAMSVCSQCQMCTDLCPRSLLGHSIKPHKVVNALTNGSAKDVDSFVMSMACVECGLCEMYACHQGLSPRKLIGELKSKLRQKGVRPLSKPSSKVNGMREGRLVPMERLIARLDLKKYDLDAPLNEEIVLDDIIKVKILLRQHIGAQAVSIVKVGDKVQQGQLIAEIPSGNLGTNIHASIEGSVKEVNESYVVIEKS